MADLLSGARIDASASSMQWQSRPRRISRLPVLADQDSCNAAIMAVSGAADDRNRNRAHLIDGRVNPQGSSASIGFPRLRAEDASGTMFTMKQATPGLNLSSKRTRKREFLGISR
jgi:hypothetical protein